MTLNVELVGGPMDGGHLSWPDSMLENFACLPGYVAPIDGCRVAISHDEPVDTGHGWYVMTRKITPTGRLIYEFRGPPTPSCPA